MTTELKPSLNPYSPENPKERLAHRIYNLGHAAGACGWQASNEEMTAKHAAIYMEGYHAGNASHQERCRLYREVRYGA